MSKKFPVLVISLGLLYFAYTSRSLLVQFVWDFTSIYSKSEDIPFPLGEGSKVTLNPPFNLIEKPYAVAIKTDLLTARPNAMLYELEKVNYPIHLKFKVYRRKLFSSYQELVFEKEIKNFL